MRKQYKVTRPFLAFAKEGQPGEIVWLTDEQAAVLLQADAVQSYEVKVQAPIKKKPGLAQRLLSRLAQAWSRMT